MFVFLNPSQDIVNSRVEFFKGLSTTMSGSLVEMAKACLVAGLGWAGLVGAGKWQLDRSIYCPWLMWALPKHGIFEFGSQTHH